MTEPVAASPSEIVEGPAFTPLVKVLATALMLALAGYALQGLQTMLAQRWSLSALLFTALAAVFAVACYGWMLKSRTRVSATHIRQTWIPDKQVALADIRQIKLIYIPGLAWLIGPRLVVKTNMPGSMVFHTADAKVLAAFARLTLGQPPLG